MEQKPTYTDIDLSVDADHPDLADLADPNPVLHPESDHLPPPPVEFLTGAAGTGKTFWVREQIRENPKFGVMCATTGIAAVNLDTVTVNSILKYYDTESLQASYLEGRLQKQLRILRDQGYSNLIIDEVSMMSAKQLDLIYSGVREIGLPGKPPFGLIITGDFCQLSPINAPRAFHADCWPEFAVNTRVLQENFRQTDKRFLEALTLLRRGDGKAAVDILLALGVKFHPTPDLRFEGTTIHAKNEVVARFNKIRLEARVGNEILNRSIRWGKQRSEWDAAKGNIPDKLHLKIGALVMMLVNEPDFFNPGKFLYANGDLGLIEDFNPMSGVEGRGTYYVKMLRTGVVHPVDMVHRVVRERELPEEMLHLDVWNEHGDVPTGPYWDAKAKRWVIGGILFFPMRLAYASTVHKSQGLTLDRVQVDIKEHFMSQPGMVYVAMSRCRSAEGLRIVGEPDQMVRRVKTDDQVKRWL